jgi:hypothetical protein
MTFVSTLSTSTVCNSNICVVLNEILEAENQANGVFRIGIGGVKTHLLARAEHRALSYNWEGVFQWGSFGHEDITAWALGTHTGYNVRSISSQPQIGVNFGATSGDRDL